MRREFGATRNHRRLFIRRVQKAEARREMSRANRIGPVMFIEVIEPTGYVSTCPRQVLRTAS